MIVMELCCSLQMLGYMLRKLVDYHKFICKYTGSLTKNDNIWEFYHKINIEQNNFHGPEPANEVLTSVLVINMQKYVCLSFLIVDKETTHFLMSQLKTTLQIII